MMILVRVNNSGSGGVRQGCVLSPRLFSAVFGFAMRKWTHAVGHVGIDLMDAGPNLTF